MVALLCDWWLENRSKCPERAVHFVRDEFGATLAFCDAHIPNAWKQYKLAEA